MAKLHLTDREIRLIKGLLTHKGMNDQQVLAVFSYLDRNMNHREIAQIRRGDKPRYVAIAAAPLAEVDELLYHYAKIASLADRLGFCEMDLITAKVHKAVEIMKTGIMVYNNNMIVTRSETFIVLGVIAWTYLVHAHLEAQSVDPIYRNPDGTDVLIDGKPKYWELTYCLSQPEAALTKGMANNLRYIIAIRNQVEHRSYEDINAEVQSKIQAAALNFLRYAKEKFGPKFDFSHDLAFTIQLQALTLGSPNMIKGVGLVSKSVAAVNALIEEPMSSGDFNDPDYAFRVHVTPKVTNNAKNADQAVTYNPVGSNIEIAIKQVERPKFRQKEAMERLEAEGVPNVTSHTFQKAWKSKNLKNPGKGMAILLGGVWFWYPEGVDAIKEIMLAGQG